MADPLTLILLVAAGESGDATTRGIADATQDALGSESRVLVRESEGGAPDDAQALATERSSRANAVVELCWVAPRHRRATLRMHVASTGSWIERHFAFRRADADAERGRTLGFAVASILPEALSSAQSPPATEMPLGAQEGGETGARIAPRSATRSATSGGTTLAPSAPSTASATPASPVVSNAPDGLSSTDAPSLPGPPSNPPPSLPVPTGALGTRVAADAPKGRETVTLPRIALEFIVVDAAGDDGDAQEVGGAGAFVWFLTQNVSLRAAISVRTATIDAAQGNLVKVLGAAGIALHPWRTSAAHPFGASLRLDYLGLYETFTHFAMPDNSPPTLDGWLSGLDTVVDASWLFAPDVDALIGAGFEAFPPTFVTEAGQRVTTLPPLRALAEAGLRLRF
jgi:hypothetical protein